MVGVGITVICIKQDLLGTLKVSESYLITGTALARNSLSFELSGIKNRFFPSELFVTFDEYRRLKIHKIKKEESELGDFILFLKQKEIDFKTVIEVLLQKPITKYQYNDYLHGGYVKYSNSDYSGKYTRYDF